MENVPQVTAVQGDLDLGQVITNNPQDPEVQVVYVLGGPASGKGTQCSKISACFGCCHLSVGELLEKEVARGSENGAMIRTFKLEGKLLPTDIVLKILGQAMEGSLTKRFLIDGFPRNQENFAAAKNFGRADDNMETIPKRIKVFRESTLPMVDYYSSKGKVFKSNQLTRYSRKLKVTSASLN